MWDLGRFMTYVTPMKWEYPEKGRVPQKFEPGGVENQLVIRGSKTGATRKKGGWKKGGVGQEKG